MTYLPVRYWGKYMQLLHDLQTLVVGRYVELLRRRPQPDCSWTRKQLWQLLRRFFLAVECVYLSIGVDILNREVVMVTEVDVVPTQRNGWRHQVVLWSIIRPLGRNWPNAGSNSTEHSLLRTLESGKEDSHNKTRFYLIIYHSIRWISRYLPIEETNILYQLRILNWQKTME